MKLKVIIPAYNAYPWIEKCLDSVIEQEYTNYEVCIIDDASTDPKHLDVLDRFEGRPGWKIIRKMENGGPLASRVEAAKALNCNDEDILLFLDGDDWLNGPWVFERVAREYADPNVLVVHSKTLHLQGRVPSRYRMCSWWTRVRKNFRFEKRWNYGHLFTCRYAVWKEIKDEDLRDGKGNYYRVCTDRAFVYPVLEMAGHKIRFIPEVLHVYNDLNPINCHKTPIQNRSAALLEEIRRKPKYPTLQWPR